jgi:hypothetical protein
MTHLESSTGGSSSARRNHPAPCPGRHSAGPGPAPERSRGGLTTKLRLAAEGKCRPLSLVITPGQRPDCAKFEPVMNKIRVPRLGLGGPAAGPTVHTAY